MLDLWYENAVVYCLDVETFRDGDGDGIGDFAGLVDGLDHLERLGVNCLWLNPFYPSPNRDNGYDISDFYGVDPRHGSLGDFVAFMHAARDRGMRVIVDLVVNHTSVDHPWFRSARASVDSPYRDWYVWKEEEPEDKGEGIVFPGEQTEVWTFDDEAQAWYLHRFYRHQADLNVANPAVREEIQRVMGFWLELGVSGFRVDAVPFLIEHKGLTDIPDGREDPYLLLSEMQDFLRWRRSEAILLAEANVAYGKAPEFFDGGERMQLVFDFIGNQAIWLALARNSAAPIVEAFERRPPPSIEGRWASFLRNHDELSLDKLSENEREEVYAAFGPEESMQIYARGLRRRLAPMLGGDPERLELVFSLLFALPGTPVIWYGDEIGLGENLALDERNAVRCPMQWTPEPGAGFSSADPETFVRALAAGEDFAPAAVNAAGQWAHRGSLLNRVRDLVALRRAAAEIGRGETERLAAGNDLLVLRSSWRDTTTLTLHNFTGDDLDWRVEGVSGPLHAHLASRSADARDDGESVGPGDTLTIPARGYRWLRSVR